MKSKWFLAGLIYCLLNITFSLGCSKKQDSDKNLGVHNDVSLSIRLNDKNGNDLLNTKTPNAIPSSSIKKVDKSGNPIVKSENPGDPIGVADFYINTQKMGVDYNFITFYFNPPVSNNISETYFKINNDIHQFTVEYTNSEIVDQKDFFGYSSTKKSKVWHNGILIWDKNLNKDTPILVL